MTEEETNAIEAAAFRRLLKHLDERKDAQNIELMKLYCSKVNSKMGNYTGPGSFTGSQEKY